MRAHLRAVVGAICSLFVAGVFIGCPEPVDPAFTFDPPPGTFGEPVAVEIGFSDENADLYITADGSAPSELSTPYIPGITGLSINSSATIRAAAFTNGSEVATATAEYTISTTSLIESTVVGSYTNTAGNNPVFTVQPEDVPVEFGSDTPTAVVNGSDIDLTFNNISVYANGSNYYLQDACVEEEISPGLWVEDVESPVALSDLTNLAIVLVLDCSTSLGSQFATVKAYAQNSVAILLANDPTTQIGIVDFSDTVSTYGPSTVESSLDSYINGLTQAGDTAYYDAMVAATTMLDGLSGVEGKAIVSFTDGYDNASVSTKADVVSALDASTIKSFTIGLEGNGYLDETALLDLAVNGNYEVAASLDELDAIFNSFAEAVSNVYRVVYSRNDRIITDPLGIRFTFLSTLDSNGTFATGVEIVNSWEETFESGSVPDGWSGSWIIDAESGDGGTYSLRSDAISNSRSTSIEVTVEVPVDGAISFYRKVSSEAGWDFLRFYVDDVQATGASWSGDQDWSLVSFPVSAGSRTFRWTYSKDNSGATGSDCAWIDDVLIQ